MERLRIWVDNLLFSLKEWKHASRTSPQDADGTTLADVANELRKEVHDLWITLDGNALNSVEISDEEDSKEEEDITNDDVEETEGNVQPLDDWQGKEPAESMYGFFRGGPSPADAAARNKPRVDVPTPATKESLEKVVALEQELNDDRVKVQELLSAVSNLQWRMTRAQEGRQNLDNTGKRLHARGLELRRENRLLRERRRELTQKAPLIGVYENFGPGQDGDLLKQLAKENEMLRNQINQGRSDDGGSAPSLVASHARSVHQGSLSPRSVRPHKGRLHPRGTLSEADRSFIDQGNLRTQHRPSQRHRKSPEPKRLD